MISKFIDNMLTDQKYKRKLYTQIVDYFLIINFILFIVTFITSCLMDFVFNQYFSIINWILQFYLTGIL